MQEYKIIIEDLVHHKIREIGEYIFRFSFDINKSKEITKKIYTEIFSLKIFPNRCPLYGE